MSPAAPRNDGLHTAEPHPSELLDNERDLAAELDSARRLQQVSTELIRGGEMGPLYERLLDAAVAIMRSDFASVQVLDPERYALRLLAFRGFLPESANFWYWVANAEASSCGMAFERCERCVIQDIEICDFLAGSEDLEHFRRNGIRSMQSTPLLTRNGVLIGMMSTHWKVPHAPAERDLQLFDVLARQVADLIERVRAETALRANHKRQAFILELNDSLRPLADPAEIQVTAARLLGEHLRVQRVTYTEIEGGTAHIRGSYVNGVRPLPEHIEYRQFGNEIMERYALGCPIIVEDIEISPFFGPNEREVLRRMEIGAFVALSLIKDDRWVAAFSVQSVAPHTWTELEISLMHETAERTWAAAARARVEQALRESEARLREMDRRKDEFLATLAHELRNPLAPIRTSLSILRLTSDDGKTPQTILDILERQVGHMVRLVDDLMEVSRITRGKIELQKERIDLVTVVRSAVETSRPLIEAARHDLVLDLPDEPLPLDADPVRVAQVLSNLLNNSARYTDDGGTIWLSARREATDAVVSVRDSGIGISEEMLPKVFDMFTQANRTYTRATGGLGIGLTLVRSIVDLHEGSVEARSDGPGQGSEFVVRLPLSVDSTVQHAPVVAGLPAFAARRILVVDDNRDAADSLGVLLRFLGAEVVTAEDGEAALEAMRAHRPSVVFLDIGLPRMDGYEVARRARGEMDGNRLTLIALTGWGQDEDRLRSREAGIDFHLVKPVDLGALQSLLAALPPAWE